MTDWTGIAAVIAPVTTLLGVLGGYGLAGRNDDARDRRAADREMRARREAFAERLEEDRHAFQRDTLLELQDELQRLVRNSAQMTMQDRATIKAQGQIFIHESGLADEGRQVLVSVERLRTRVLDHQLRAAIGEFVTTCTTASASLDLMMEYPGGKIPENRRAAALRLLDGRSLDMAQGYKGLNDVLGAHLRRELDRRYLLADPGQDDATGRSL